MFIFFEEVIMIRRVCIWIIFVALCLANPVLASPNVFFEDYLYDVNSILVEPTSGSILDPNIIVQVEVDKGTLGGLSIPWDKLKWNVNQSGQIRTDLRDADEAAWSFIYYTISAIPGKAISGVVASPRVGGSSATKGPRLYASTRFPGPASEKYPWDFEQKCTTLNEYLTIDLTGNPDYEALNTIYFIIMMPHGAQGFLYDFTISADIIDEPEKVYLTMQVDPNDPNIVTIPAVGTSEHLKDTNEAVQIIADERVVLCPKVYGFDHWSGDLDLSDPNTDPDSASTQVT